MAAIPAWHVEGDWFDVCKCNAPCPCTFAQPPSYGNCDGILAYHIRRGRYDEVSLGGRDQGDHGLGSRDGGPGGRIRIQVGVAGRSSKHIPFDWSGPGLS